MSMMYIIQHRRSKLFASMRVNNGKQSGFWNRDFTEAQSWGEHDSPSDAAQFMHIFFPNTPAKDTIVRKVWISQGSAQLLDEL